LRATPRLVALVAIIIAVVAVGVAFGSYYYSLYKGSPQKTAPTCSDPYSAGSHIYNPDRLVVYKDCQTVSGIVDRVIVEADGDYHVRLGLDTAYQNLTNSVNDSDQYGDLVLEIVCANTVTQQSAVGACANYVNHVTVPQEGQHITAIGRYVLDNDHGWTEIHPVYSLTIAASLTNTVTVTGETLIMNYPDGATTGWLGPTRFNEGRVTVNPGDQYTDTLSLYSTSPNTQQITSITISTPGFSIKSISPNTPISFTADATVIITLTIQTPTTDYSGPIDLQFTVT
jgi:hypothetical protein